LSLVAGTSKEDLGPVYAWIAEISGAAIKAIE
jgi:hypothetical protein